MDWIGLRSPVSVSEMSQKQFGELQYLLKTMDASTDSRLVRVVVTGCTPPVEPDAPTESPAVQNAEILLKLITENSSLRAEDIKFRDGAINWKLLREMVEDSEMPRRKEVLGIIDNIPIRGTKILVGRLGTLMRLDGGKPYRYIVKNFFPLLRNATCIKIYVENITK